MSRRAFPLAIALLVAVAGCQGGALKGVEWTIDTQAPESASAGTPVAVTCVIRDQSGHEVKADTQVSVDPTYGATIDGLNVILTKAGKYAVKCGSEGLEIEDRDPWTLEILPAAPAKTSATVDPATSKAGTQATVTCRVEDAFGNLITDAKTAVDAPEGVLVEGQKVSAKLAGVYALACRLPDATAEYQKEATTWTVTPADPASVELLVDPDHPIYYLKDEVTLAYKVRDAFDNLMPDVPATFQIPAGPVATVLAPNQFRFDGEGAVVVSVTLDAPWSALTASRKLTCDVYPPVITILFPDRGMTFDGDGTVNVKGTVTDAGSKVEELLIDGQAVEVGEDGAFEYPVQSLHGANGIVVEATDTYNRKARTTRGWYYSTKYVPVTAESKVEDLEIEDGAMVFLGQQAMDDGDHNPAKLNDLATILEVMMGSLDFKSLIGQIPPFGTTIKNLVNLKVGGTGLSGDLEIKATVSDLVLGKPKVGLKCRDGGLDATITLEPAAVSINLSFILHLSASFGGNVLGTLDPSTTTTSKITINQLGVTVGFDIEKLPGKELTVEGKNFKLVMKDIQLDPIQNLVIDLGSIKVPPPLDLVLGKEIKLGKYDLSQLVGPLNDLIANNVLDPLLNLITQPLMNLLEPFVTGLMGDAIQQLIGLLALHQTIDIPPLLGGESVPLEFATQISSIVFKTTGGRVGLKAGVLTAKKVDREPLGSILRDQCAHQDPEPVLFEFTPPPSIQLGVRYDLVNELLFMVWWAGITNQKFDLSSVVPPDLPISDVVVTPNLLLPPILDDCNSKGMQQLQVAGAYLDVTFVLLGMDQHLGIWLQARATAGIIGKGNEIGIRIDKVNTFETEITDIGGNMGDLMGMIDGLVPTLLGQIEGREFTFPIPAIDIGTIIPGLPAGTKIQLGNLNAFNKKGVAVIGGDLQ